MKLTEKQKRFADYYIEKGNATQSYIDAGYKASKREVAEANARKLLANNSVKHYIDENIKSKDKKRIASQDEVLELYTKIARGQEKDVFITYGEEGDIIENKVFPTLKERIRALDALAKRYGIDKMIEEKSEEVIRFEFKRS